MAEEVKKNKEDRKKPIIPCDNTVAKEIFRRWFENTNSIKY
jgi:hypothetical protein